MTTDLGQVDPLVVDAPGSPAVAAATAAIAQLVRDHPEIAHLADDEERRRDQQLNLVAASSPTLPGVRAVQAMHFGSLTAEGYPGRRYHPGTEVVDQIEDLARTRAQMVFASPHANVQPVSGSASNLALLHGLVPTGRTVLSLDLTHGGHLSHVSPVASVSRRIPGRHYHLRADGQVDLDQLAAMIAADDPAMVICGGSASPRVPDFEAIAAVVADSGALLLADISHISGLVAGGVVPSPIPHVHLATTSTYKQLSGPRGGLILQGATARVEAPAIDRCVFPGFQGTPDFGRIAAKAVALAFARTAAFRQAMARVVVVARMIAAAFQERELRLVSGGTDTHMVLVDLRSAEVTGKDVEEALVAHGVLTNANVVPGDPRPATQTSGLRIGTNDLAFRAIDDALVERLGADLAAAVGELSAGISSGPCVTRLAATATEVRACEYVEEMRAP